MSKSRSWAPGRVIRFRRRLREQVARDVAEEIRFHLDQRTEELVAAGLSETKARSRAMSEFGDRDQAGAALRRESGRMERRTRLLEHLDHFRRDLRHALRSLGKTPGLTVTILATVGLGLGATTAIFAVVHAVLIQPLPYPEADRLYGVHTSAPPYEWPLSVVDYQALAEQQTQFAEVAGYANVIRTFNREEVADRVAGKTVTWTYLPLLGLSTMVGRGFTEADADPQAEPTVIVSYRFWNRYLSGDRAAIGSPIRLDGQLHTVVGVLGPDPGPLEMDREFFVVARWGPPERRGPFFIRALGRLKDGTSASAAEEELRLISGRIFPIWEETFQNRDATWAMMDLKEEVVGDAASMLVIVFGAVAFVLLIASVNAANLLLARVAHRTRELAVRAALGASRRRLLQHLWAESTILAIGGAGLGLLVASLGTGLITRYGADYLPRTQEVTVAGPVLGFLLLATLGSALLFGLIPSLSGGRFRIEQALRSGGRISTDAAAERRLRGMLVAAEFAVAAPLLVGAGLLIASLANLQRVDPGFDPENLLTFGVSVPSAAYPDMRDMLNFIEEAQARIEALPGVTSAGFSNGRPPNGYPMENNFTLPDHPLPEGATEPSVPWISVTPEYFQALSVLLIEGRAFDAIDLGDDARPVLMVDRTWARHFFPGESALGREVVQGGCPTCEPFTIVGVVESVRYTGLDNAGNGVAYWPYWPLLGSSDRSGFFFVRTSVPPKSALPSVRAVVREIDATLPVSDVATMEELLRDDLDTPRYLTALVAGFAILALLLSIIGIYGVMANFVQRHRKDMAIRIAVGGGPTMVARSVVNRGMRLVIMGVAVGIVGALLMTRHMSSLLYEVNATDAFTFALVPTLMLMTALVACFLPARRAAATDPVEALRAE
jgi:predicted permease